MKIAFYHTSWEYAGWTLRSSTDSTCGCPSKRIGLQLRQWKTEDEYRLSPLDLTTVDRSVGAHPVYGATSKTSPVSNVIDSPFHYSLHIRNGHSSVGCTIQKRQYPSSEAVFIKHCILTALCAAFALHFGTIGRYFR
jgi:hypothetical protein